MKPTYLKAVFLFSFLFLSLESFACHGALSSEFTHKDVAGFDYVTLVKITNTSPMDPTGGISPERPWFFTAEIQELQVFIGSSVANLKIIQEKRKFGYVPSWDQGIDTGEEWLIFGKEFPNQLEIHSCSPTSQFNPAGG